MERCFIGLDRSLLIEQIFRICKQMAPLHQLFLICVTGDDFLTDSKEVGRGNARSEEKEELCTEQLRGSLSLSLPPLHAAFVFFKPPCPHPPGLGLLFGLVPWQFHVAAHQNKIHSVGNMVTPNFIPGARIRSFLAWGWWLVQLMFSYRG